MLHVWYRLYVPMQIGREALVPFPETTLLFLSSLLKQIVRVSADRSEIDSFRITCFPFSHLAPNGGSLVFPGNDRGESNALVLRFCSRAIAGSNISPITLAIYSTDTSRFRAPPIKCIVNSELTLQLRD